MIYTDLTKKALKLCFDAHKNQVDKTGLPYVFHPFHLAEQMDDENSTILALLHDVVEDTEYTYQDILKLGVPLEVVEALRLLTHEREEDYFDYIKRIKTNSLATKVKLGDIKHNSNLTRIENVTEEDLLRVEKYKKAIEYLNS